MRTAHPFQLPIALLALLIALAAAVGTVLLAGSVTGVDRAGATWNIKPTGATSNGATWNGATWNGATWNGATWNGATWN